MKMKRMITLAMAVLLLALPQVGYAAVSVGGGGEGARISVLDDLPPRLGNDVPRPYDMEVRGEGKRPLLILRYELSENENIQRTASRSYVYGGKEFTRLEILQKQLPATSDSRTVYKTVTVETAANDRAAVMAALSPALDYQEDGYSGKLAPDYRTIQTAVSGTVSYSYPITQTREFYRIDRADVCYIPKTIKNAAGVTLKLDNVQWAYMGVAERGAHSYTATATYTGTGYGTKPSGYVSTVQYKGEVNREIPGAIHYTVIYQQVPPPLEMMAPALMMIGTVALLSIILYTMVKRNTGKAASA